MPPPNPIVIFDGDCPFCCASVQFILKHESDHTLLFAPRQSPAAQQLLTQFGFAQIPGTMVLIENGKAYIRSTATLQICRHLRYPWRAASSLLIIPAPLRDLGYKLVARFRHLLKRRNSRCTLPTESMNARFLFDTASSTSRPSPN